MKELAIRLPFHYRTRAWISQGLFSGLMVLLAAGIVHIITVLLVPQFAARDGHARLAAAAPSGALTLLDPNSDLTDVVPGLDPLFVHGACKIDVSRSPYAIDVKGNGRLWLMALYDRRNTATFSLNDRALPQGDLDMLLVTPAQNARLREVAPQRYDEKIVLELEATDYVAIVRVYAPGEEDRAGAAEIIKAGTCGPTQIDQEAG